MPWTSSSCSEIWCSHQNVRNQTPCRQRRKSPNQLLRGWRCCRIQIHQKTVMMEKWLIKYFLYSLIIYFQFIHFSAVGKIEWVDVFLTSIICLKILQKWVSNDKKIFNAMSAMPWIGKTIKISVVWLCIVLLALLDWSAVSIWPQFYSQY